MERQAEVDKVRARKWLLGTLKCCQFPSFTDPGGWGTDGGGPCRRKIRGGMTALDQKNEHNMEKSQSVAENEQETRGMERVQVKEALQMKDQMVEQETVRLQQSVSKMGRGRERVRKTHV